MVIHPSFWASRRVLITGHTGFKGAWTSLLLTSIGANVSGLALEANTFEDVFHVVGLADLMKHRICDIRNYGDVSAAIAQDSPEVVIHMAAQALVRPSYSQPIDTFATNVMGTAHVLEAIRNVPSVKAVIIVTSDKCYENVGSSQGYQETDPLGGHDPYSASKAAAEIVSGAYRRSFFGAPSQAKIATVRAGNVIGGGDWSTDRLVPDAMRAFRVNNALAIRNPAAVRPWQHVIDPILGYLLLAETMLQQDGFDEAWNFGPGESSEVSVRQVVEGLVKMWEEPVHWIHEQAEHVHEAAYLRLDCRKAQTRLGWQPAISLEQALSLTVDWYKSYYSGDKMRDVTLRQIDRVLNGKP